MARKCPSEAALPRPTRSRSVYSRQFELIICLKHVALTDLMYFLQTLLPAGNPSVHVYVVVYDALGASSTAAASRAVTVTNRDNVTAIYRSLKDDLESSSEGR
jgi:hypothetical protein